MIKFLILLGVFLDSLKHPSTCHNLELRLGHGICVQVSQWLVDNDMGHMFRHLLGQLATVPAQHGPQLVIVPRTDLSNDGHHSHEQSALTWTEGLDGEESLGQGTSNDPVLVH